MGIEPTPSAWKAEVLPLNYTRNGRDLTAYLRPLPINEDHRCGPVKRPVFTRWQARPLWRQRDNPRGRDTQLVEGGGFEPPKAEPADLQSAPFDHSGTPPKHQAAYSRRHQIACQPYGVQENQCVRDVGMGPCTAAITPSLAPAEILPSGVPPENLALGPMHTANWQWVA